MTKEEGKSRLAPLSALIFPSFLFNRTYAFHHDAPQIWGEPDLLPPAKVGGLGGKTMVFAEVLFK